MRLSTLLIVPIVFALAPVSTALAIAPGRVQIEIVGDSRGGSALAFQDWLAAFSRAGIKDVRLRTAHAGDEVRLDVRGSEQSPVYVVTGMIGPGNELILPGARFKRSDMKRLAEWIEDLAQNGPVNRRPLKASFGLTVNQLEQAQSDLARPVGFSTKGMGRAEAVKRIAKQLAQPLRIEGALPASSDGGIDEELREAASGTALACILRPLGYCMVPKQAGQGLSYVVSKAKLDQEVWPVGWPCDKAPSDKIPELFEFRNVNVQNVAASKLLEAVAAHIKVPVLVDHNALARHGIDAAKTAVSHPQSRTNYSIALRKMLFQAGMKFEVRVDESGKPFLWVTSVKPV